MQAFTVPTIFTAVDKYSGVLGGMGTATQKFNNRIETLNSRSERLFKKMTPALSDVSKQFLGMASAAAVAAGVIATARFSVDSIMNYEDALQSFRTIVSDLSDKDFAKFEGAIGDVAKESKKSTIEVAQAFEKIAGLNSTFADTTEGISAVTSAAITLSKASRDELGVSAENLVGILNQFSLGALEADRTINVLAAGQAVGAASITQTSETFKVFGAVAKQSNLSLEQSVALTEVLASKQIMGAEAGTALRGTLVRLKASGLGYQSGLFNTRDALEEVNAKYAKLKTAKEKDALLDKVFGTINLTTGSILMENIGLYDKYTKGVTGTTEATKAAEINSNTLSNRLKELSNAWVTLLTDSTNVNGGLNMVKDSIGWLTENMSTIISVGVGVLGFFTAWKLANLALRGSIMLTKAMSTAFYIVDMIKYVAATQGMTFATAAWSVAQSSLNAVMLANPIGVFIVAVLALVGTLKFLSNRNQEILDQYEQKLNLDIANAINQEKKQIDVLIESYKKLGLSMHDATLKAIEFKRGQIQSEESVVNLKIQKNVQTMNENNGFFDKTFGSQYDNAAEDLAKNREKKIELAARKSELSKEVVRGIQSKSITVAEGSNILTKKVEDVKAKSQYIGNTPVEKMAMPDELMRNKDAINPKMAQQNATAAFLDRTILDKSNTTITFKNQSDSEVSVSTDDKTGSTLPAFSSTTKYTKK